MLVVLAVPVRAQLSTAVGVGAFLERSTPSPWRSSTRFEPAIRLDNRWGQLGANLSMGGGASALRPERSDFSMLLAPPPVGGFRLSTQINASRFSLGGITRGASDVDAAVSYARSTSGAWLGLREERSDGPGVVARPLLHAGVWRQFGTINLTLSTQPHEARLERGGGSYVSQSYPDSTWNDTTMSYNYYTRVNRTGNISDSNIVVGKWRWSDIQARLGWSTARFAIDATAGTRPRLKDVPSAVWARVSAVASIAPRLSVIAMAGTDPGRLWIGAPPARYFSLGARISSSPSAPIAPPPHVRPTTAAIELKREDSVYVVSLHVPDARTVELSGDFNGWKAIALRQSGRDTWETVVALTPGAHRVSVRVNGDRWMAPSGLAAIDDEFNGTVGLLLVR